MRFPTGWFLLALLMTTAFARRYSEDKERNWENWEERSGNKEKEDIVPPCLRRHDRCRNVKDGDYQLCFGCASGNYIRCENGSREWRQCPTVTPADAPEGVSLQLIFDPLSQSCVASSPTCIVGLYKNQNSTDDQKVNVQGVSKGFIDFIQDKIREQVSKKIDIELPETDCKPQEASVNPPIEVAREQEGDGAGEQEDDAAGEQEGDAAGEQEGDTAGEQEGDVAGEQEGDAAGVQDGEMTGEQIGDVGES